MSLPGGRSRNSIVKVRWIRFVKELLFLNTIFFFLSYSPGLRSNALFSFFILSPELRSIALSLKRQGDASKRVCIADVILPFCPPRFPFHKGMVAQVPVGIGSFVLSFFYHHDFSFIIPTRSDMSLRGSPPTLATGGDSLRGDSVEPVESE